jgi:diguanylate cyclase (GGDEF)-like protein/PAS domain S-box-containing protein
MFEDPELFRLLLDNLHEGVYFVDTDRAILYWNKGAERISGYSADEVTGRKCSDGILTHVDDEGTCLCTGACPLAATIRDGCPHDSRIYLKHKDGHRLPVEVGVSPIRDATGTIIGGIETFHDASTMMAAIEEAERLKDLALLCPLTGLGNRRYTEEVLAQRMDEMKRKETVLGLLFFDVDHFKKINDSFGHHIGDIVLKMVARTLAAAMRSYDFLGRWGGEEMLAILPLTEEDEIKGIAERLRLLVKHSSQSSSKGKLSVSVSIGAYVCKPEDTVHSAVASADLLMYQSKNKGRNRVTTG